MKCKSSGEGKKAAAICTINRVARFLRIENVLIGFVLRQARYLSEDCA
jgi:hypothetical protein